MVRYSHLFQNFPQFIVIHPVKAFGIVNKAEIDVFLELSCFSHDPADVGNLISGSNCCFLTCIQVSEEIGEVFWYSYLSKNFPQFVVIHTVKGFCVVNETEVIVLLELSCFFYDSLEKTLVLEKIDGRRGRGL